LGCLAICQFRPVVAADPLPSWNEGASRKAILEFVEAVTDENGKHYVKPSERIAVFDNDGTLWVEQPMYTQVVFAADRFKLQAAKHPEWKTNKLYQAVLAKGAGALLEGGEQGLVEALAATHSNMTTDEFLQITSQWLATAKHPRFDQLYTQLAYQPQLELLAYLRDNGFKTFVVSGGGIEFMRPWSEPVYGIPPEQVIGSSIVTEFQIIDGKPVLMRLPKVNFIDDKAGKPVSINQLIGRRPIFAYGNSDADIQMVQYTKGGDGLRLGLFVHHTDAVREYAYDRESLVGKLDQALNMAAENDWILTDMKREWKQIFSWQK
jgi:hypothetical protein